MSRDFNDARCFSCGLRLVYHFAEGKGRLNGRKLTCEQARAAHPQASVVKLTLSRSTIRRVK
jgi:DNA-directed RNA polymerase subunit N (RpoN/RPB10)